MRPLIKCSVGGFLAILLLTAVQADDAVKTRAIAEPAKGPAATPEITLSGPYTHENLTIFLIHGKDALPGKKFLTLQEALEQKKLVVHETKNVNQLAVENVSDDAEVFIQAGDILKGGSQDRTVGGDIIVSAKSGKVPLPSFCVESGRWQKRGNEDASKFSASSNYCNCRGLRLSFQGSRDQAKVWEKVKDAQDKLEKKLGASVKSKDSPTSLQLTLEDKKILENLDKCTKELGKIVDGKKDAIGYVVIINGAAQLADVYPSADFFAKVWPRMLKGSAVDALAQIEKDKKFLSATAMTVQKFLAKREEAKKEQKTDISKRIQVTTKEGEKFLFVEARDRDNGNVVIRRSYITLSPTSVATRSATVLTTDEDRKLAKAQVYCAIEHTSKLGSQGRTLKVMCKGRPVFCCCQGCAAEAAADPDAALAMLDKLEAKLKAKKTAAQ
jgi:hypothetical protein